MTLRHARAVPWWLGPTILGIGLLAALGCGWAQRATPEPEANVLTLEQAMRLALERNPSMAIAEGGVVAQRAALAGQRARRLPTVTADAGGRIQQSLARPVNVGGGVIETRAATTETSDITLALSHAFFQSGLDEAIAAARAQTAASEASLVDTQRTLLLQVAQSFFTVLADQELAAAADEAVRAAQLHLELVDARIEAGTAAPADRLPVEAELAEAQFEAVSTLNAIWQALADLQALLALPADELPLIRGELAEVPPRGELQRWLATALAERPDLQAQRHRTRATELALRQAEISAGLTLSAQGQADYGRHTGTTGETWSLAAGVSYPLFDRQARASVDQARANLEVARQRQAELELSIAREVTQAWYALSDAEERVTTAGVALAAAASSLEAARERYAEGVADIIEVTDAEVTWRRATARLIQARYDRSVAYHRLLAAGGVLRLETSGEGDAGTESQP
ncbi:MAG: TolC family protein [Armatimonadota bacterium]